MRNKFGSTPSRDLVDACEVVHYGIMHDTPVLIKHVKILWPDFDLST